MNALKGLRESIRRNASEKHYPTGFNGTPVTMNLNRHIEIFNLIKEYEELENDCVNTKSAYTRGILGKRMGEIQSELYNYWIVREEEMEVKPK